MVHLSIPPSAKVLDLCCGTGFSSTPWGNTLGVDTSIPMLTMAKLRNPRLKVQRGNAETYGEDEGHDIVTIMFGFHEMPQFARRRILRNAMRVARSHVLVVDICPTLVPTPMMLSGEPYILDYLANVDSDVQTCSDEDGWEHQRKVIVPGHVVMWRLDRVDGQELLKDIELQG